MYHRGSALGGCRPRGRRMRHNDADGVFIHDAGKGLDQSRQIERELDPGAEEYVVERLSLDYGFEIIFVRVELTVYESRFLFGQ